MGQETNDVPNPKRVAAGRRNRLKRKGLTEAGRQRLREAALRNQPWQYLTGPRTAAGKAQAAANGKLRQIGELSVREVQWELTGLDAVLEDLAAVRRKLQRDFG